MFFTHARSSGPEVVAESQGRIQDCWKGGSDELLILYNVFLNIL